MLRINTKTIERIEIIGPNNEIQQARDFFDGHCISNTSLSFYITPNGEVRFRMSGEREIQIYESMEEQIMGELMQSTRPTLHAGDGATPAGTSGHSLSGTSQAEPGFTNPPRA